MICYSKVEYRILAWPPSALERDKRVRSESCAENLAGFYYKQAT